MSEAHELRAPDGEGGEPPAPPIESEPRLRVFLSLVDGCRWEIEAMAQKALGPRLRGRVETSDVLQEAVSAGAREFGRYFPSGIPSREEFMAWFRAVLHFRVKKLARWHLGAQGRDPGREEPLGSSQGGRVADPLARTPSSLAMERERDLAVEEALAELPEKWRTFVHLVYFEGLRVGEAGRRLGWKPRSTHAAHWKILRKLGRLLGASGGSP